MTNSTPQVVVFDLGKVLLDFDYRIAAGKLAARSDLSVAEVHAFINQSPLLHAYETGLLTKETFFAEVRRTTGFRGELGEFAAIFGDIFTPITDMIELHAALRGRGIPTYIFSNTNELAVSHIRQHFPFFGGFDGHVFSYEHGAMKPDAKLYEVVEGMSRRRGGEILYLDDRPENVAAGAARGWQTILHAEPGKSRAAIQALGLLD
jgi:2-haloacid dehalogenase